MKNSNKNNKKNNNKSNNKNNNKSKSKSNNNKQQQVNPSCSCYKTRLDLVRTEIVDQIFLEFFFENVEDC